MDAALKILAVDDNTAITHSMRFIFAGPRYQVTGVQDGDYALAKLDANSEPYDVIIVDQKMPHLTGVELVQRSGNEVSAARSWCYRRIFRQKSVKPTSKWTCMSSSTSPSTFKTCARPWTASPLNRPLRVARPSRLASVAVRKRQFSAVQ